MSDRSGIQNRTLVLRVLVPSLQTALRDKMAAAEEDASRRAAEAQAAAAQAAQKASAAAAAAASGGEADAASAAALAEAAVLAQQTAQAAAAVDGKEGNLLDLEGVTCEPAEDGSSLWNFHCDGTTYPARLMNLPCPVEVHKTHDHAMYHKCTDVGQILLVYEDSMTMEEMESSPHFKIDGFPSYYHSGLTPPLKRVVERRFVAREHRAMAPPRSEVIAVEKELIQLIERISKDNAKASSKSKTKAPSLSNLGSSHNANRIIEEIHDEIVDYEPWMDDNGRQPYGVEFDEKDIECTKHPEVYLDEADEEAERERLRLEAEKAAEAAAEAAAKRAQEEEEAAKKKQKKKQQEAGAAAAAASATPAPAPAASTAAATPTDAEAPSSKKQKSSTHPGDGDLPSTKKSGSKKDGKKKSKKKSKEQPKEPVADMATDAEAAIQEELDLLGLGGDGSAALGPETSDSALANNDDAVVEEVANQIAKNENNEDEEMLLMDGLFDFDGDDGLDLGS